MQVNAILSAIATAPPNTGKKISTTISHLRQSQKDKAMQLGAALNALTTNTFENVQVNELDVIKSTPTLTLSAWQTSSSEYVYSINYTGNGDLFVNCTKPAQINSEKTRLAISASTGESFSGTIFATETDSYYSIATTFQRE